jgi:hypothetical protein
VRATSDGFSCRKSRQVEADGLQEWFPEEGVKEWFVDKKT